MKIPPKLKIWGQTAQIPKLFIKKITQNFFQNFFLMFSPASKHLKFYYIAQYSRFRPDNFKSQLTYFQLEYFDDFYIFGILTYNIYNKILILEWFDQFYFFPFCSSCPQIGKESAKINKEWYWSDCFKIEILL